MQLRAPSIQAEVTVDVSPVHAAFVPDAFTRDIAARLDALSTRNYVGEAKKAAFLGAIGHRIGLPLGATTLGLAVGFVAGGLPAAAVLGAVMCLGTAQATEGIHRTMRRCFVSNTSEIARLDAIADFEKHLTQIAAEAPPEMRAGLREAATHLLAHAAKADNASTRVHTRTALQTFIKTL